MAGSSLGPVFLRSLPVPFLFPGLQALLGGCGSCLNVLLCS